MIEPLPSRWDRALPYVLIGIVGLAFWFVSDGETFGIAATPPLSVEPRSQVIGVKPADTSTGQTVGTTPVDASAKTDMTKSQASSAMPMPGQANDHSTLAPKPLSKEARPKP